MNFWKKNRGQKVEPIERQLRDELRRLLEQQVPENLAERRVQFSRPRGNFCIRGD